MIYVMSGVCGISIAILCSIALAFFSGPIFNLFTPDQNVLAIASILVAPAILNIFGSATRSITASP